MWRCCMRKTVGVQRLSHDVQLPILPGTRTAGQNPLLRAAGRMVPFAAATAFTVLVSTAPLGAKDSASKGHATTQTVATRKGPPTAQPAQPLAAAPVLQRTEVSKSTAVSDAFLGDFRITQLTRPTPVKPGQCIAGIELLFGMNGCVTKLCVTHITKAGIGIANMYGRITTEDGIQPFVIVKYGETKVLGAGFSNNLKVHVQKGADGTPLVTAVFIPSYTTETYIVSPGALIMGPPALRVVYVGSSGVGLKSVFNEDTLWLAYGEIVRTIADSLPVTIAVRKVDEPGQAKLHITHLDGVEDAVSSPAKKQPPKPAKPHPNVKGPGKSHGKQRK